MNNQPAQPAAPSAESSTDMRFVSLDGEKLRVYRGDLVEMNMINGFPVTARRPKPPIQFVGGYYPPAGHSLAEDEANDLLNSPLYGKKYALAATDDAQVASVVSEATTDVPEGYARIDGEVLPLAEAFARMQAADPGAKELTRTTDDELEPIEGVTTKQEALEELAKRGVKPEDLTARDTVEDIITAGHKAGYCFPSYEDKHD